MKDKLDNIVGNVVRGLAPIQAGVITAFDKDTNTATVRCTHRSGRGFTFYEIPWILSGKGTIAAGPRVETPLISGTHVVLGFRGSDWSYPILLNSYDPVFKSTRREEEKRNIDSYTTKTDRSMFSEL